MGGEYHRDTESVVVPAIDAASSVACMRSLGKRGISTVAVSERKGPPGFRSRYCRETVTVPDPTESLTAYRDVLLSLAERDDVRTIIPVREADVYVLARDKAAFGEHVGTPWPGLERLRNVQDRVRLFEAAKAAGVSIPATETLDTWTEWERDVVVKPRYTVHASEYRSDVETSHPQQESTRYVASGTEPDRATLLAEMGHVPLVQEYVPNTDEYGFFALYDRGDPVATFQHRQRRGYKYSGGPSAYRESVDIPELEAAGRRLLDHLEWHGLAMVEFLRDSESGTFKLMEVNPRFWTSLPFTVQAGVDFPHLYWLLASDQPVPRQPGYDVGVAGHLLRGELLHLHSILFEEYPPVERPSFAKTAAEIAVSVIRHPRFDYLDVTDLGPFVQDSRNVVAEWLTGR